MNNYKYMGYPLITFTAGDDINPANNNTNFRKARDGRYELQANEAIDTSSGNPKPFQIASNGWIEICDANDASKIEFAGFVLTGQNVAAGEFVEVMMGEGFILDEFTGLTRGSKYYVQDDQTIGTTRGTLDIFVGYAISSTEILIQKGTLGFISSEAFSANDGSAATVNDTVTMPDNASEAIIQVTFSTPSSGENHQIIVKRKGFTTSTIKYRISAGDNDEIEAVLSGSTITITGTLTGRADGDITISGTAYFYR